MTKKSRTKYVDDEPVKNLDAPPAPVPDVPTTDGPAYDGVRQPDQVVRPGYPLDSRDPIDAFDPLTAPAPRPPDGPTLEQRNEILTKLTLENEAKRIAVDALTRAVEHASLGHGQRTPETLGGVRAAVLAAEKVGVKVNRGLLISEGLLAADLAVDIDAAPAVGDRLPPPLPPEPGELEFKVDANGNVTHVVMYNPTDGVVEPAYNGERYPIRPHGRDFVHIEAANLAVGADNCGGPYSKLGVRRLFGPEKRFEGLKTDGLSIADWCRKRNSEAIGRADGDYSAIAPGLDAQASAANANLNADGRRDGRTTRDGSPDYRDGNRDDVNQQSQRDDVEFSRHDNESDEAYRARTGR